MFVCRSGAIAPSRAATFGCCGDSPKGHLRFVMRRFGSGDGGGVLHSKMSSISNANFAKNMKKVLKKNVYQLLAFSTCFRNERAGLVRLRTSSFPDKRQNEALLEIDSIEKTRAFRNAELFHALFRYILATTERETWSLSSMEGTNILFPTSFDA